VIVLGVDIGVRGAIAVLDGTQLVAVHDMPCLDDGPAKRRSINAPLLVDLLVTSHATQAFVEHVAARPGEGPAGAFAFGRSRGLIEGVLASFCIPVKFLTPPQWKRIVGIPPGKDRAKDMARSEAIRRWPGKAALFSRKADEGKAEAALIAVAGILRESDGVILVRRPREPRATE